MSLEHLKELKLPYYFYSCGNDTTIASMRVYAECQDASLKDALERHLYAEHTIIDDRVVKAMRNKANCIKRFYLKNAWTFGILFTDRRTSYRKRRRVDIFGTRSNEKTFLQEKLLDKLSNTPWTGNYINDTLEISNVDEKKYDQSVRSLIKAVS